MVRTNEETDKLPEVRCRHVASYLYGERLDGLVTGVPRLTIAKLLLSVVAERNLAILLLGVGCAFFFGAMRENPYIELPQRDPKHGNPDLLGKLKRRMCAARGAPQFGGDSFKEDMPPMGFSARELHPAVYWHPQKGTTVVVHMDDFLRAEGASR